MNRLEFAYVTVVVRDVRRAARWYRDALGFRAKSVSAKWGWAEVAVPGASVRLALVEPRKEWGPIGRKLRARMGKNTGVILHTKDILRERERLAAKDVRFTREPRREPWGGLEALFVDPDGNEFHLVQALKK